MRHCSRPALFTAVALACLSAGARPAARQAHAAADRSAISEADLREFLTYIASDELEGRAVYTEGLGLAAAYIAGHLKEWGVEPGGDAGSYFQRVTTTGVRSSRASTVTVTAAGQSRTFRDADTFLLPGNMGAAEKLSFDEVEFVGYGVSQPSIGHDDYAGADVKGKLVMYAGGAPAVMAGRTYRRTLNARGRTAVDRHGAAAVIEASGWAPAPAAPAAPAPRAGRGWGRNAPVIEPDFSTTQRFGDAPIPPVLDASDALAEFVFQSVPGGYAAIKAKAAAGEPLPRLTIPAAVTIDIRPGYEVVRTQYSRNVIGIIRGSDPALRDTYVAFGAHYDHVGTSEYEPNRGGSARIRPDDRISNGADDDGSGTVALLAMAKAFARGARPRRSLMFIWHTGEERGLLGSRFNAERVDPGSVAAVLNIDMIGRNAGDDPANANQVFIIGSDRISTELHNVNVDANAALPAPLTLDYSLNDPADPESLYTRSDHYSYAAKGIPIIFFFTGLHPDYHQVSDEVALIDFDKLTRITQLVYETGLRVANLDHLPARDNRGPRAGKGFSGKLR